MCDFFLSRRDTFKPNNIKLISQCNDFMTVECFTKSKKYAPTQKRCHFAGTFTFQIYAYMFLKVFLFQNSFTLQNEDIKDQQGNTRIVKTDRVEKNEPRDSCG